MTLPNRRCPRRFVPPPTSPHLLLPKIGSTVLERAFCQLSCSSSSAAIGFQRPLIPSAAGRKRVHCRRSLPALEIGGGMCAPSMGRTPPDDQSRYRKHS